MDDVKIKLQSDRLWALGGFLALIVVNAMYDLGLEGEEITAAMWSTIAFILGKSVRSTVPGAVLAPILANLAPKALEGIDAVVPDVPDEGASAD